MKLIALSMEESEIKLSKLTGIRRLSDFSGSENGSESDCNTSGIEIDLSSPDHISDLNSPDYISHLNSPDYVSDLTSPDYISHLSSPDYISDLNSPDYISHLNSPDYISDLKSLERENSSGIENDQSELSFGLDGSSPQVASFSDCEPSSSNDKSGVISYVTDGDKSNFASHCSILPLEPRKNPSITVTEELSDGWKRSASRRMSGKGPRLNLC